MIPMIARPLDQLVGPPDPAARMVPVVAAHTEERAIWLAPAFSSCVENWHLNPGAPGEPEPLPWKRTTR